MGGDGMTAVYMQIKPELNDKKGQKCRLVFGKAFEVEKDTDNKIKKTTVLEGKPKVLPPETGDKKPEYKVEKKKDVKDKDGNKIGTTEKYYPELPYQSVEVATLADGNKIVLALIEHQEAYVFVKSQDPETTDTDPLSKTNQPLLGIDQVIGKSKKDVIKAYPELEGQKQIGVDEKGKPVMVDKIFNVVWAK